MDLRTINGTLLASELHADCSTEHTGGKLRDVGIAGGTAVQVADQAANTAKGAVQLASSALKGVGPRDSGGGSSASDGDGSNNSSELHVDGFVLAK